MGDIQFGLILPENPLNPPSRYRYMYEVDRLLGQVTGHFDSAWVIDHLDGDVLESWTTVAYLSALHPNLQWGHTVLCQSFRNPALLAKMASTLQFLSGGRFVFGIGACGDAEEHIAYGYPFPSGGTRVAELDEALQIVRMMWTQERTTFEGRHHGVRRARLEPKPEPIPPIMVGAFRPKMLRLTARHADWWNVSSTDIQTYRAYVDEFELACAEEGRDPAVVRRVWSGGCVCAPTEAEVASLAMVRSVRGDAFTMQAGEDIVGTPAQVIAQLTPFIELGVDMFLVDCGGFPSLTTVETLIDQVFPVISA